MPQFPTIDQLPKRVFVDCQISFLFAVVVKQFCDIACNGLERFCNFCPYQKICSVRQRSQYFFDNADFLFSDFSFQLQSPQFEQSCQRVPSEIESRLTPTPYFLETSEMLPVLIASFTRLNLNCGVYFLRVLALLFFGKDIFFSKANFLQFYDNTSVVKL